jgi:hypothetical protein
MRNVIEGCCTAPVKDFQCWSYCAVEESTFPTWLGCVQKALNSTSDASCQRANQSQVLTATGPYPASFQNPPPPLYYTPPSNYSTKMARNNAATTVLSTSSSMTGVKSTSTSTRTTSPSPTNTQKGGSTKASELSLGGVMCALLILSAFTV